MENKTQQQKKAKKQYWPMADGKPARQRPFLSVPCPCDFSVQPLTQQRSAEVIGLGDSSRERRARNSSEHCHLRMAFTFSLINKRTPKFY